MSEGIELDRRPEGLRGLYERFTTQNSFVLGLSLLCLGFGAVGVGLGCWVLSDLGALLRGLVLAVLGALVALTGLRCFWTEWAEGARLGWLDALMERSVLRGLASESVHAAWIVVGRVTIGVGAACLVGSALSGGHLAYAPARDLTFGLGCAAVLFTGPRTILVARQLIRDGS